MRFNAPIDDVLEQLRQQVQNDPGLAPLLPTYEALLVMEESEALPSLAREYTPTSARRLLEAGTPLLHREESVLLSDHMADAWRKVCKLAAKQMPDRAGWLEEAQTWPETQEETWLETMKGYFRTGTVPAGDQENKDLLAFLLVHTWRPFLRLWATGLAPLLEATSWKRENCPICGGQPDLAYLSAENGERHLICGRCDTDWRYQRLGCPFCKNQDATTYGYYTSESGEYRLYVCKKCQRYLKTIDLREAGENRLVTVERITTSNMDLAALQAGFRTG